MYGDMTLLTGNSNRALAARISEALGMAANSILLPSFLITDSTSFTRSHTSPFLFPPAVCAKVREPVAGMIGLSRPGPPLPFGASVDVQNRLGSGTSVPPVCPAPALGIRDILISGSPDTP